MYRDPNGNCGLVIDLRTICDLLVPVQQALLKEELRAKMERATTGDLRYGEYAGGAGGADVEKMACTDDILELRLASHPGDEGVVMMFRLYFSEPDAMDKLLLGLHLNYKQPGPIGLDEQSRHAKEAQRRFDYEYHVPSAS